jgi:tRNA modification GTPase
MPDFTDTIAALATPTGTSAIAVVRISGPDTMRIAGELSGAAPLPRRLRRVDYPTAHGELLDEVLLVYFAAPKSYTGEDSLEISCHGNPFIAQKILEDLFRRGCRAANPGEFTQRAFLNGKLDLSQAEAVMDLIHAQSDRAIEAANQQLRGSLGRRMDGLISRLVQLLATVEAYIDFPDEDLPPEDRTFVAAELQRLMKETDRLLATSRYGELLRDGVKTVIIGRPNVGKSSLLNRLVGKERAIVSSEPGTTRDFIEERLMVGPHCLRIIDTAGLNPSPAPLEKLGMDKTLERIAEADLFMLVFDGPESSSELAVELRERLRPDNTVIVLNKSDLGYIWRADDFAGFQTVQVSALQGTGIAALGDALVSAADRLSPELGNEIVAINARHARALTDAQSALRSAESNLALGSAVELLASDLRTVLDAFSQISGRVDNEAVLDALFASFCIGK